MSQPVQLLFSVRGEVQGVGFRFFAHQAAERHHIAGYVRNLPDGTVEVLGQGTTADLEAFEAELRKGPAFSHVEAVERVDSEMKRKWEGFHIVP